MSVTRLLSERLQVGDCFTQALRIVTEVAEAGVAAAAKQTTDLTCYMVMIDGKRSRSLAACFAGFFLLLANGTYALLLLQHLLIALKFDAVILAKLAAHVADCAGRGAMILNVFLAKAFFTPRLVVVFAAVFRRHFVKGVDWQGLLASSAVFGFADRMTEKVNRIALHRNLLSFGARARLLAQRVPASLALYEPLAQENGH